MPKLITTVLVQLAACASVLSLYFTLQPINADRPWWHWPLIAIAVIAWVYLTMQEITRHLRSAPRTYRSPKKINKFMYKWISSGGRIVIFSRDMSWTDGEDIRRLLLEKARRNELTVCLEYQIPFTNELQGQGANIVTYGTLGHVPRSRFTIVDFDREGARVAVGARVGGDHVIQQFRSGSHPYFAVAEDLVKFLIASNRITLHVPQG